MKLHFRVDRETFEPTFNVTESFMDALRSHLHDFIVFPETEEETRRQIAKFAANSDFSPIVGAIDGMFIKIIASKDDTVAYICIKKFHGLVVQAVVDHNMDIATGFPGSFDRESIRRFLT